MIEPDPFANGMICCCKCRLLVLPVCLLHPVFAVQ